MATLKADLKTILDRYGIDPRDKSQIWDCHGTLVLYHKAYEIIAAKENIRFDAPVVIEACGEKKIVALLVAGYMGDRREWSIGEAAPGNSKNAYPYAMAEKRAKDRVIGKLVGLAAYVYSEDEADEFKDRPPVAEEVLPPPTTVERPFPGDLPSLSDAAREYVANMRKRISAAGLPSKIDKIVQDNANSLARLKGESAAAYDDLIAFSNVTKNELLSRAA